MSAINEAIALKLKSFSGLSANILGSGRVASRSLDHLVGLYKTSTGYRAYNDVGVSLAMDTEVQAWHFMDKETPQWRDNLETRLTVDTAVRVARGLIALECSDQREFLLRRTAVLKRQSQVMLDALDVATAEGGLRLENKSRNAACSSVYAPQTFFFSTE